MMKHFFHEFRKAFPYKAGIWLISLICIASLEAFSQAVASNSSDGKRPMHQDQDNIKLLETVLMELASEYGVSILFDDDIINQKKVNVDDIVPHDLEESLNQILRPLDLEPKKIKEGAYIIQQAGSKKIIVEPKGAESNMANNIKLIKEQERTITGKITDENNEPLPGANVLVKGTTMGTISDVEGNYRLMVSDDANTLVFSSVGYETQEVTINGRSVIDMQMVPSIRSLEEIVVVGYGTQQKSDLTGTIASVSSEQLVETAAVNVAEALNGQVSGVQIQQTNGAPGGNNIMVRVRGASSITSSNDPLYVIDGYPMENADLSMLNPNDIQSIEVLKDASASAIYGSRGGNGVVIITTKSGKGSKGKTVELNINTGIQQISNRPDVMNSYEYAEWFIDGHNNAWIQEDPENHKITDPNEVRESSYFIIPEEMYTPEVLPNTDWGDLIFRNAMMQNYQLNFSNNNENGHALIGGSYVKQDGIVIATDYEKFNLRSNFLTKISERWSVGGNIDGSYFTTNKIEDGKYGPVELSLVVPPVYPVYNPDGTYGSPLSSTWFKGDDPSPLEGAYEIDWLEKGYRTMGKVYSELEIIPGLKYNLSLGGVLRGGQEDQFRPSYLNVDSNPAPNLANGRRDNFSNLNWLVENMLNYDKNFGENHSLQALLGFTVQKNIHESSYMYATNFPNDQVHTLNAGQVTEGNTLRSEHSLISYLGRVNYNYADKYLLTATVRTDGSSRFGENNKWGTFPSASIGWRISEENFMKNVGFIDNQKLRVSYGYTGNYNIPNYGSIGLLGTSYYVFGSGSGALHNAVYPNTISNPNLGWERTQQFNIGMDMGLFANRIYFEIDYYSSLTKDLLLNVPVPRITGYESQYQNIGKVRNRGLEFMLNTRNLVGAFTWSSNFNFSFNRNKVLALGPDNQPIYASAPNASNSFITEVGSPISNMFGYIFDGVYTSQEQINSHAHLDTDVPGDPIIRDVNGDGQINADDRTVIGNNQPDFIFGLSNSFTYKNFDFNVLLSGSYGAEVLTLSSRFTKFYHGDRNARQDLVNRYRSPEQPGTGEYFIANRLYKGLQKEPSSYWIQDASFLRIKNATLGYNFTNDFLNKTPFSSLRAYFSITNLFTFTDYWGFDPEVSTTGTGLSKGGDYSGYPLARTFLLGLNVKF